MKRVFQTGQREQIEVQHVQETGSADLFEMAERQELTEDEVFVEYLKLLTDEELDVFLAEQG